MCGVFGYTIRDLEHKYGARWHVEKYMSWEPRYSIKISEYSPVIVNKNGINQMQLMRFGLVPKWSKTEKLDFSTFNAKSETVSKLPTYAEPFRTKRVAILATGFFESKAIPGQKHKQPYYFQFKNQRPFVMAGVYDVNEIATDKEIWSYSIITQEPGALVSPIHHRQPVLLDDDVVADWLDPNNNDPKELLKMLKPYPQYEKEMETYPVSNLVYRLSDAPEIIEPLKLGS